MPFQNCIIYIIKLYHNLLSPYLLKSCRFYPSCSVYAVEAIQKKGVFKGLILSIFRVLRCNQFSDGGYDPVNINH